MEQKIIWTQNRVKDFYDALDGNVYLSFSGGKDSQVLAEIIKEMPEPYKSIELVFFNTHNENPSVFEIVRQYGATIVDSPMRPRQVIEEYGYPLFNKDVANVIDDIQRNVPYTNDPLAKRREQIDKIKEKYRDFIKSPLRISDKCCDVLKKRPSSQLSRQTGKKPIIGTLATESRNRMITYLNNGCNTFSKGNTKSTPMSIWKKSEILDFIVSRNIRIAECYGAEIVNGECRLVGVKQTGCMFCGFGKGMGFAYKILKSRHPEYYARLEKNKKAYLHKYLADERLKEEREILKAERARLREERAKARNKAF